MQKLKEAELALQSKQIWSQSQPSVDCLLSGESLGVCFSKNGQLSVDCLLSVAMAVTQEEFIAES